MQGIIYIILFLSSISAKENAALPFLLNSSKPYVYLEFDHAGDRMPIYPNESKKGIWLKFVNNCRIPVTIKTFDPGSGDPGIGVQHEVVPIQSASFSGSSDDRTKEDALHRDLKPPSGYSAELATIRTVKPGESVLFSVPLDNLSPNWYLRVEFTLDVSGQRGGQPYSYAEFRWEKLPKIVREMSMTEIR
jgi:hypothetical protein